MRRSIKNYPRILRRCSRREALSTWSKLVISAILAGVIGGIGGYYTGAGIAAKTITIERTKTITVTETVDIYKWGRNTCT